MKPSPSLLPDWRFFAVFLILAATAGALWHLAVDAYRQGEIAQHRRELAAITEVKLQRIQSLLEERRNDAAVLGGLTFAREALAAAANSPQQADHLRQLELIRAAYRYRAVLLFDASARLRLAAGAADSDEIAAVLADNDGFGSGDGIRIASLRLRAANGAARLLLQIVAPVRGNGARAGTLVLLADSLAVTDPLAAVNRERIASREVVILERRGAELRVLNTPLFARPAELSVDADNPLRPAAMAARGIAGAIEGEDYRGVPVIAHVGRIPESDWLIVTKEDRADALASTHAVARWSGVLTALLLIAAGIALAGRRRLRQNELALARTDAARQALRSSEARFRKLNEHATDISLLFDRAMVVRYATPSAAGFLGRAAEGEPMASGTARVHPDDVAQVEAARRAALERPGIPQGVRHRLLHGSDGWRVMEATFTSLFDDPNVDGLSYQAHDITERTAAEQALRDSEERYRYLFELSPDAVFVHSDGIIRFANAAAARLYRAGSAQALIGRHWHELVEESDRPKIEARIAVLLSGEVPYLMPVEMNYRTVDGAPILVESTAARIVLDGKPAVMSVQRDITERRQAEAALRDSEARFRTVFENVPVGLVLAGPKGTIRMPNPAMCAMFGYTREELEGRNFRDITWPEDLQTNLDVRRRLFAGEIERFELRKRYVRKDGSILWGDLVVGALPDADGNVSNSVAMVRDITAQIEAEAARRDSETTLRLFLDTMPGFAFIMDRQATVLYANRVATQSLGVPLEKLIGANVLQFLPPDVAAARKVWGERAVAERKTVRFEDSRDGRDFETFICPIPDHEGNITRAAVLAFDITERKQDEAKRLELARQQRDTLVREVHHRIKNHLQGLTGLLRQHMHEQPALEPVLQKFAAQITAISIVHGLQGRAEKGDASLRSLVAEITAFLGSITGTDIGPAFPAHACHWSVSEAEAVPVALILNELLTNALRHGQDTAGVTVAMECEPSGACVLIRNPGHLAAGIDLADGRGLGTGLSLIRSLLPPEGAALRLECREGWVEARLELAPPVLLQMDQLASRR